MKKINDQDNDVLVIELQMQFFLLVGTKRKLWQNISGDREQ